MQQQELSNVRLDEIRGAPVYDSAGEKIGKVEELFYDAGTNVPEWVGIGTGFFGTKRVLVPVQGASVGADGLTVAWSKEQVKDSPDVDSDEISGSVEADLRAFYGLDPTPGPRSGGADEDEIVRSEEEVEVGTRQVEAGTARLRKWVETEPVALDVQLSHEVARVTREPIDRPVSGHEFSEEQVEVPLHAEKPVVQKQTVAKERIGLETDVETVQATVRDEVRKERVEVEGDVEGSRG